MDSDGHLIGVTGIYHITSVTVTSLANPTQQANGRALYVPLDAGQWIGATPNAPALKDLWEQAHRSSAIHRAHPG